MANLLKPSDNQRLTLRFVAVAALVLALGIPLLFVDGVSRERQAYFHQALEEVAAAWGREQTLMGPLIVVPVKREVVRENAKGEKQRLFLDHTHVILPRALDAEVTLQHEFRQRSLYSVPVYNADVSLTGVIDLGAREAIDSLYASVDWARARLVVGLGDTRAIRQATISLGRESLSFVPGSTLGWLGSGVHVPLPAALGSGTHRFLVSLRLGGSKRFAIAPIGDQTQIDMRSTWPHPSFNGDFLPETHRIGSDGFSARWSVNALARGVPSHFLYESEGDRLHWMQAGVDLHQPVTSYTTVDRGIKYGMLIIALTFLTALCFELLTGARLHLIQYAVVGLALVMFYLTLLSLSEHVAFATSYAVAASVTVALLGWYGYAITRRRRVAAAFVAVEAALYGALFVLLRMEDAALLTGTGMLLLGLVALMAVTRNLHEPKPERDERDRNAELS